MKIKIFLTAFTLLFSVPAFHSASADELPPQNISLSVTDKGYEPPQLQLNPDKETILTVTRKTNDTCATSILIPQLKVRKDLPLNLPVQIKLAKLEKGEVKFSCAMKMMGGVITVK